MAQSEVKNTFQDEDIYMESQVASSSRSGYVQNKPNLIQEPIHDIGPTDDVSPTPMNKETISLKRNQDEMIEPSENQEETPWKDKHLSIQDKDRWENPL